MFAAVDVMAAARRAVARFANVDEASASFVLAGSTSKTRAIFADASLEMTRRIEKLLKKKVADGGGESPLGLTLVDADARARTCSFAYATSSFVQASVQHARGDAFFAALRACDASVTPAVRDAADQAHAILLAAIERVEARRAKKKAEREAAEAAAIRAKMTPRSVKLRRRREEAPREPSHDADPSPKPSSDKAIASDGSNPDRRADPKPDPTPPRDPPPDVGPATVAALALAEAVLTAATNGVASLGCERDPNAMVNDGNDIKERDDAVDRVGPASTRAWSAVGSLRGATIDKATGRWRSSREGRPPA